MLREDEIISVPAVDTIETGVSRLLSPPGSSPNQFSQKHSHGVTTQAKSEPRQLCGHRQRQPCSETGHGPAAGRAGVRVVWCQCGILVVTSESGLSRGELAFGWWADVRMHSLLHACTNADDRALALSPLLRTDHAAAALCGVASVALYDAAALMQCGGGVDPSVPATMHAHARKT